MSKKSSERAGINGAYIEKLILGISSNPYNFIDDEKNRTEIKSCQEYHNSVHCKYSKKRSGCFRINLEQHKYLIEINGFYLFVVHDYTPPNSDEFIDKRSKPKLIFYKIIKASEIETQFKFLERKVTKHHYFSINWKRIKSS